MWTDSRLIDSAPSFCLCLYCEKSDMPDGIFCPIHEKFMGMTETLGVAAPIFACPDFVKAQGRFNYMNQYYEGGKLVIPSPALHRLEILQRITDDWKAQKKRMIEVK